MNEMIITQGGLETIPQINTVQESLSGADIQKSSNTEKTNTEIPFEQISKSIFDNLGDLDIDDVLDLPNFHKNMSWKEFLDEIKKLGKSFKNISKIIKTYRKLKNFVDGEASEYLTQIIPGGGNALNEVINIVTNADELDKFLSGEFEWKVSFDDVKLDDIDMEKINWTEAEKLVNSLYDLIMPEGNGKPDVFFCNAENLLWNATHAAQHLGIKNGWNGTGEIVEITGKNIISKIIIGTKDINALLLNDNSAGDALFLDDQFSANGNQQRLAFIDEIQAGAGDDVIDLTSQKFEYAFKDSLTIRGGNGDDVIWANCGQNIIFGDKGNDRIIGGKDDDTIIGGAGNDSMHGGGGNDTFCFGGNFGNDTVEQLAGGKVTLWFDYGSEYNWNAETMTYSNGSNSVKVTGITADQVELKFGTYGAVDKAFADFSSEKVYDKDNILHMIVG